MLEWKIDLKLFCKLAIVFILMAAVGTLHHESGHYLAGKMVGMDCRINYYSTGVIKQSPGGMALSRFYDSIHFDDTAITNTERVIMYRNLYETDIRFRKLADAGRKERFIFTIGGPLMTMLTGTIGFVLLLFSIKSIKSESLSSKHYVVVFISLFWLRQPMNFAMGLFKELWTSKRSYRSDEFGIASYLHVNHWLVIGITAVIGFSIATYIVFRIIPVKDRLTFIAAGFVGGSLGYYLWLVQFGKYILP